MSACHCVSCSQCCFAHRASRFHCIEQLKEIPVSSLVRSSSHIKKENKKAKHDVGNSGLEWIKTCVVFISHLLLSISEEMAEVVFNMMGNVEVAKFEGS